MPAEKYLDYDGVNAIIQETKRRIAGGGGGGVSWATSSDAEIVAAIQALDTGVITTSYLGWGVGDERVVHLNAISAGSYNVAHAAQDVTLVIYEVDNYNGVGHYIIGFKDCLNEKEKMEDTNTNANGWHNSKGRKCCDAIYNMIPSSLSPIFKTFTVTSATKGGSDTPGTTDQSGKLALLAEKEIFGSKSYSCQDEFNSSKVHSQFTWFKTSANKKKKNAGIDFYWFGRSSSYNNSTTFCCTLPSGASGRDNASYEYGFAPFGVI